MNPYLTIYSQTENPDDDPADGDVIAFGLFQQDRMTRCWVLPQASDRNLSPLNVHSDDPERLEVMIQVMLEDGDYVEIDPARFRHVRGD